MQRTLVARAPSRPLIWLGDKEPASFVERRAGARFPATSAKEMDFVVSPEATIRFPRDPVG